MTVLVYMKTGPIRVLEDVRGIEDGGEYDTHLTIRLYGEEQQFMRREVAKLEVIYV